MMRRQITAIALTLVLLACFSTSRVQADQRAYGRVWGGQYNLRDWERFYHYPYVFYSQNFWGNEYYRSSESLYYRYPPEMRIPVYNRQWHNYYPQTMRYMENYTGKRHGRLRYHSGHHFMLDVF